MAEYVDLKKNPQGGDMGNESPLITKHDFVVLERMKEQVRAAACLCYASSALSRRLY